MAILGIQFDKMRVTPAMDANKDEGLSGLGVGAFIAWQAGNPVASGMNVQIPGGGYVIRGRYIRVTEPVLVPIPANFSGVVVLTVDLTKSNDSSGNPVYDNYSVTNNQVYFRAILPGDVRTEDINNGGQVFDSIMCNVTSNATSVTQVSYQNTIIYGTPSPADARRLTVKNDRVYEKIALNNTNVGGKYQNCNITLRRNGRICFAKMNFKPLTALAWEQLLDIGNFPGYRPDGGDYSGILNEMMYNSDTGGAYIAGTTLRIMHVGRTDVQLTNYSGVVTYVTNDDFPSDGDIIAGYKSF